MESIKKHSVQVVRGPVIHSGYVRGGDGSWGENEAIYILDPDGHRVEIFWALATIGSDGIHINYKGEKVPGTKTDEL